MTTGQSIQQLVGALTGLITTVFTMNLLSRMASPRTFFDRRILSQKELLPPVKPWVKKNWQRVLEKVKGTGIEDIEEKLRTSISEWHTPHIPRDYSPKYQTLIAGYYSIASGYAPDYIVDDTFRVVEWIWDKFGEYLVGAAEGKDEYATVVALTKSKELGAASRALWGDTKEAKTIETAYQLFKEAEESGQRLQRITAIDGLFHAEHAGGGVIDTAFNVFDTPLEHYAQAFAAVLAR